MFQILAISLVLTTESLNTAIEKILDFVHPDYNEKVGYIKDISAGAVFFAFIFALFTALMIYLPKLSLSEIRIFFLIKQLKYLFHHH